VNISTKPVATFTSREFNQDTARAKRAAVNGPVFITDRGEPSYVLLTKEAFDRLTAEPQEQISKPRNLAEALAHPESAHIDFEPPRMSGFSLKIPDFE
jgi:PHD/YefM family antitoxin component YafN of YafNO toxin-antitoxin module